MNSTNEYEKTNANHEIKRGLERLTSLTKPSPFGGSTTARSVSNSLDLQALCFPHGKLHSL